jgi:hypothetical protein
VVRNTHARYDLATTVSAAFRRGGRGQSPVRANALQLDTPLPTTEHDQRYPLLPSPNTYAGGCIFMKQLARTRA